MPRKSRQLSPMDKDGLEITSDSDTESEKRKRTIEKNNRAGFETTLHKTTSLYELREQLELTTNEMNGMRNTMDELVKGVKDLKQSVIEINQRIKERNESNETQAEATFDFIPTRFTSQQGPFPKYTSGSRTLPRPTAKEVAETLGGKEHSLQFTSNLYIDLIERALGPQEENPRLDYKAMVKEAILVTKAVVSHVKEIHRIDPDIRWSYIDPTVKLETYKILENATEHLLPLKMCLEFWGAHVLICNFWVKRKKYEKKSQRHGISPYSIPFLTNQ